MAAIIAAALALGAPTAVAAPTSLDVLSWSDEFNGPGLDTARWADRASGPRHDGILTPDAVSVGGGVLTIKTYTEGGTHYSGMISTYPRGADGFEQAYGYFEARIKFHSAPGQWSSFWLQSPMIGSPIGDPASAGVEMDVVEHRARCVTAPAPTPPATCAPTNDIAGRAQQALIWDGYGPESQSTVKLTDPLAGLGNDSCSVVSSRAELALAGDSVTVTVARVAGSDREIGLRDIRTATGWDGGSGRRRLLGLLFGRASGRSVAPALRRGVASRLRSLRGRRLGSLVARPGLTQLLRRRVAAGLA